ncbi:unnamed protein product, partial [Lampetra planeri]
MVTAEMCQNREDSDITSKMVEELNEDSADYPLVLSGHYGRWFHSDFCDFISVFVAQCQHSVVFDSYLMNALISLLSELSNSYVRAFRHTCTLAAVKLLSSLMGVALSLSGGVKNGEKLLKGQKAKTVKQRIRKNVTELQERQSEIESMMDVIFKGVFLKRYRDVLPEIRSICMEELGLWMKLYSSTFLNDSYLKYIGWMMHDKDRIISMTLDKDHEVAVQTLKLLLLISKTSDDVLSPDDYQQLFPFVYSSQRPLAVVAGELLFSRLLRTSPGDQDGANEEEAHKQQTLVRLKALLQFYQDSGVEQAVLVEIVLASVRQASEGPTLAGRSGAKKFSGSSDIVASLMKIPQYFLPESPVAESEQVASSLLAEMRALLDVHADPGVLEAAACTYLRLCEEDMTLSSVARAARDAMVQCWVDELTAMLQDSLRDDSFSADEEKTGQIVAVLKRLRAFHNCHDLSRWNLFELLSPLLPAERSQGRAPPQVPATPGSRCLCGQ